MWLIFRIIINLYYKLYRALYYPLTLLAKRGFGLVIMAGIAYVIFQIFSGYEPDANQYALPSDALNAPQAVRFEDGNSSFATDLLPAMSGDELRFYSQTFYWVMNHQPAGKMHEWAYQNTHGQLTPQPVFKNNYGHQCRRFDEMLKVGSIQQTLSGIACQKKGGGWCKLGANFTPICGLAPNSGIGAWWDRTVRGLF